MKKLKKPVTDVAIKNLKQVGKYSCGDNLYFQVSRFDTRSWLFRYWIAGKERLAGLGPYPLISLAQARDKARDRKRLLLDGVDPIEAKREHHLRQALEAAKTITFGKACEEYIQAHAPAWKDPRHARQWRNTLATHCAALTPLAVAAVDTEMIVRALEPIWHKTPETASRTRRRIEAILDWAKARGLRSGDNPARWRGHLDKLLAPTAKIAKPEHHAALPYSEVPAFVGELQAHDDVVAKALTFCILTATRTSEVRGAKWEEIDIAAAVWTIPTARMKAGKPHRVPLSPAAIELLSGLPRTGEHIFAGFKSGKPIGADAMRLAAIEIRAGVTVHGFRSSFRDFISERTNHPREVAEAALAHQSGDKTERAYARSDLFEHRRRLMDQWAKFITSPEASAKVIAIR